MIYVFGDFELDERQYSLYRAGEPLKLEPKVLDVLLYLVRARDRVVTKDELIEQIWQGQVISDAALTHCLAKARRAVEDDGDRQQVIKTQHGRGYRFIAAVVEHAEDVAAPALPPHEASLAQPDTPSVEPPAPSLPTASFPSATEVTDAPVPVSIPPFWPRSAFVVLGLVISGGLVAWQLFTHSALPVDTPSTRSPTALIEPGRPALAVLPFANLSSEAQQGYFADGLTEDLITALSRISGLFVVARNSLVTYKGKPVKADELGRQLGVHYVLEGSVRKEGERVRVTAQLMDTTTGYYVWAERYDRPLSDIFALQDDITQNIVTALAVRLKEGESLTYRLTENVEGYEHAARGWEYYSHFTQAGNTQARQMFEKAIGLDPKFTTAHLGLGRTYLLDWLSLWDLSSESLDRAEARAQYGLTLDPKLPAVHAFLADVYLVKKQHDQALDAAQQAISLDPSFAYGYTVLANILNFAGQPNEAISVLVEKAMRLDPGGAAYAATTLGHSYFLLGRSNDAIAALKRTLTRNPDYLLSHVHLAALYAELGLQGDAASEVAECLRLSPHSSLENWQQRLPFKDPQDLQRMLDALQKAGMR